MKKQNVKVAIGVSALNSLIEHKLLPRAEYESLRDSLKGEEAEGIAEIVKKAWTIFDTMPKTYDSEGVSDPVAHLHYFIGSWDWWITEKDMEDEQLQAFGFVRSNLCPEGEFGYISIPEITGVGAELDLYFTPVPISQVRKGIK
jgi:hypothetical protein